jgi:lipid II:glycine glycyltransferase (peptidoglycan interpeptide bridge formation enzyme)
MEFNIKEIKDKGIWERFLSEIEEKTFLQSWNWGEFNKNMGDKIFRFGIYERKELIATALILKVKAKRATFMFVPHGLNVRFDVKRSKFEVLKFFLEELKKTAKGEKADFIRMAPIYERTKDNIEIFKKLGFRTAPIHVHPDLTWELGLEQSIDQLLMQMRKTTRYLIRKAEKDKDVEIVEGNEMRYIEDFNNLYQQTKERQHFTPFSLEYLKKEFSSFFPEGQISVFLGKYRGEVVSSGVFIFWQGIGFYHHGASSLKYPKVPVSYQLLWEAIKRAKDRGCKKFNFWGIAPVSESGKVFDKNHPWAGLTLFKMGFGGNAKEYVKTQDFIISQRYYISFLIETLRKMKRGL